MANYPIHENPTRDEWAAKIDRLTTLKDASKAIKDFRKDNTSPFRKNYDLDIDYLFIECKLEEKLADMKGQHMKDDDLLTKTADGECPEEISNAWIAKMKSAKDKFVAEKVLIEFRQTYKPPVMPVNAFLRADATLGSLLMEVRNTDYYGTTLGELRKQRGVRVVHLQDGLATA
ncbi:MAG: hypothetical protein PHT60_07075 [Acidiphilium sp.]|nr:hypothetical protein [Acidiphilium sp.]MDD4935524.1 hypothetical protein [Acidiphilium sp.]